jgi:hypothetical protein
MNSNKEILDRLFNIWFQGKHKLIEFEASFPDKKEIIELREEFLPDFFDTLNEFYWNYFLITIARLLDPYKQGQNTNLTLYTLSNLLKEDHKSEWKIVLKKTEELKSKYHTVIKYRRKNLAHFDLDYSIGNRQFKTSTHIDEVIYFFDQMLELINLTYEPLGFEKRVPVIIKKAKFKGGNELNRILTEYKKYYAQQRV